jgi:hypothetical protein
MFQDQLSILRPIIVILALLILLISGSLAYLYRQPKTKIGISKWIYQLVASVSTIIVFFILLNNMNTDVLQAIQNWGNMPLDYSTVSEQTNQADTSSEFADQASLDTETIAVETTTITNTETKSNPTKSDDTAQLTTKTTTAATATTAATIVTTTTTTTTTTAAPTPTPIPTPTPTPTPTPIPPSPSAPLLYSPSNQSFFYNQSFPTLSCSPISAPSGGATRYYFEVYEGPQTGNSGWISSTTWSPGYGSNGYYKWRVKCLDTVSGKESSWSSTGSLRKSSDSSGLNLDLRIVKFGPYDAQGNYSDKTSVARGMISGNSVTINASDSFFFTSGDPGPSFTKYCIIIYRNQWNEEYQYSMNEGSSVTINNSSRIGSFLLDGDLFY